MTPTKFVDRYMRNLKRFSKIYYAMNSRDRKKVATLFYDASMKIVVKTSAI